MSIVNMNIEQLAHDHYVCVSTVIGTQTLVQRRISHYKDRSLLNLNCYLVFKHVRLCAEVHQNCRTMDLKLHTHKMQAMTTAQKDDKLNLQMG